MSKWISKIIPANEVEKFLNGYVFNATTLSVVVVDFNVYSVPNVLVTMQAIGRKEEEL